MRAKKAMSEAYAHQHNFGLPHIFLTITPDDENSFLVEVYYGDPNHPIPVDEMSDTELQNTAKRRTAIRLKFPGLCAFFYETIVNIVVEEIIGWDTKSNKAKTEGGLFGVPLAFSLSTEEQSRRTLHMHILIWIQELEELRYTTFHGKQRAKSTIAAKQSICKYMDEIASTALDPKFSTNKRQYLSCFSCGNDSCSQSIAMPKIVSDQQLRNLRHEMGQNEMRGAFAYCQTCTKYWTSTELTGCRLTKGPARINTLQCFPESQERRLKAMAVEYQSGCVPVNPTVVNASYNFHIHTKSCFATKNTKKRKRIDGASMTDHKKSTMECRYRYPKRGKKSTYINQLEDTNIAWYSWNGTSTNVHVQEMNLKRDAYDAFQNENCRAVTQSRICCNSNVTFVMNGRIGQYNFKYAIKGTEEEDTAEYEGVQEGFQRANYKMQRSPEKSDVSKACSMVLTASYSHQKSNIVGAAMASYLTQRGSRFIFSHTSVWCPLQDIISLLQDKTISTSVRFAGSTCFYSSFAMDYLCRPDSLDKCSVRDFFSEYEVLNVTTNNRRSLIPFTNTGHPSHHKNKKLSTAVQLNGFYQGIRKRMTKRIPRVNQRLFTDSASFQGNILDEGTPITEEIQQYAMYVLCFMYPFRKLHHLQHEGCYAKKLRKVMEQGEITNEQLQYLQNIQDSKSNSFRISKVDDDLQRHTEPFQPKDSFVDPNDLNDEDEEEIIGPEGDELDQLLEAFLQETESENPGGPMLSQFHLPKHFSIDNIQMKGDHRCGYDNLCPVSVGELSTDIIQPEQHPPRQNTPNTVYEPTEGYLPTKRDLVSLLLSKRQVRTRKFQTKLNDREEELPIPEANGSRWSIRKWAKLAGLDAEQTCAFQIFCSTFVLSFHYSAGSCVLEPRMEKYIASEKKKLKKLADMKSRGTRQLVCLLHGPGGSGKTAVTDLTIEYCQQFCSFIEGFQFTSQTIVVTALSGVAATNLMGETTHKALYLNQRRAIDPEQVQQWLGVTRLVIVDEISFASRALILKMHKNLTILMQDRHSPYGGANVIFLGDFRQLHPVRIQPLYNEKRKEFFEWINCYIELYGMYRFEKDPEYGQILCRVRDGNTTKEDIQKLNRRVLVDGTTVDGDSLPCGIKYGTSRNKERDAINAGLFQKRCVQRWSECGNLDDTVLVFMSNLHVKTGKRVYTSFRSGTSFWQNCSESDLHPTHGTGRLDPVLRLYIGCPVMLTQNICVANGLANGSTAVVTKICLKESTSAATVLLDGEIPVRGVSASDVECICLQHMNKRVEPQQFTLSPEQYTFQAHMLKPQARQFKGSPKREYLRMKGTQIPIVLNGATTAHKLQGTGVDNILVNAWSYQANWPYVMLSRVRTYKGLFMSKKLSTNLRHYRLPPSYVRMLQLLRKRLPYLQNTS